MEWIATFIAVLAAAAVWQAIEARGARRGAQRSASESKEHEERAVAAAERIAQAMEEQAATDRVERERYRSPWHVLRQQTTTGVKVEFRLDGEEAVRNVRVRSDGDMSRVKLREVLPDPMRPGQAGVLWWAQTMASPPSLDVHLTWSRENGEEHEQLFTLP